MKYTKKEINSLVLTDLPKNNLGADPEFFIIGSDGEYIEAAKVLMKQQDKTDDDLNVAVDDGFQGEIHCRPDTCREILAHNIARSFAHLFNQVSKLNDNVSFSFSPAITLPDEDLKKLTKKSMQFHCAPSYNAYNEIVPTPNAAKHNYRYAGGHMHMQVTHLTDFNPIEFAKLMDLIVGLPCVLFTKNHAELEAKRREYYGRAGEFRFNEEKAIFEYRTPSAFWLKQPETLSLLFGYARVAMCIYERKALKDKLLKNVDFDMIQHIINTSNYTEAKEFISDNTNELYCQPDVIDPIFAQTVKSLDANISSLSLMVNWHIFNDFNGFIFNLSTDGRLGFINGLKRTNRIMYEQTQRYLEKKYASYKKLAEVLNNDNTN